MTPTPGVAFKRRSLTLVYVTSINAAAIYKMRGWDTSGLVYYHWTTDNPNNSPPVGAPTLTDIVIAAVLELSN